MEEYYARNLVMNVRKRVGTPNGGSEIAARLDACSVCTLALAKTLIPRGGMVHP